MCSLKNKLVKESLYIGRLVRKLFWKSKRSLITQTVVLMMMRARINRKSTESESGLDV